MPEQASEFAHKVDWINHLITDISLFFTVAIVGTMIVFAVIYRRKNGVDHETPRIEHSTFFEALWTIVPTIICIFVAGYGYAYYNELRHVPPNAMTVRVIGQKWKWDFEYSNGKKTVGHFVVPVDEPVKLLMESRDVLHSFFIPAMRIKTDVVPGQYTYQWFKPIKTGTYPVFCTEYCGTGHSAMLAKVDVVSRAEYDRWLNDKSEEEKMSRMSPAEVGQKLYTEKGCNACHSLNGVRGVGPSFLKIFGKDEKLVDGSTVKVDENYIRQSLLDPNSQVVEGFLPQMPSQQGQLDDNQIAGLIAFIKAQDGTNVQVAPPVPTVPVLDAAALAKLTPAERGKMLYQSKICVTCHSLDGSKLVGPSFKGLYGKKEKLADGTEVDVNDDYLKSSIANPAAQIVEGYQPVMPPMGLKDDEIADLIEFIKSVK